MLVLAVESTLVDTSGSAFPALVVSRQAFLRTHLFAHPRDVGVMHGILCNDVEDTCILVRRGAKRAFAEWHVVEQVLGLGMSV